MIDVFAIVEDYRARTGAGPCSCIELDRSAAGEAATALLLFATGSPRPAALLKATTDVRRARALETEHANLTRVHAAGAVELRAAVPAALYLGGVGGATVLAQTAVSGTRMKDLPPGRYFASAAFRGHFAAAAEILDGLARALPAPRLSGAAAAARARDEIARYRAAHRVSPELESLLAAAAGHVATIEVPLVRGHGDFCTANLVIGEGDRLYAIDWEYPLDPGWPLADLLYLAASTWCVPYRKGRAALLDNQERLFFARHAHADLLRGTLVAAAARQGLTPADLAPLAALAWVAYANRKRAELDAQPDLTAERHLPLIALGDGACLNLELLARRVASFLPG